jgi:hypothetical protein
MIKSKFSFFQMSMKVLSTKTMKFHSLDLAIAQKFSRPFIGALPLAKTSLLCFTL